MRNWYSYPYYNPYGGYYNPYGYGYGFPIPYSNPFYDLSATAVKEKTVNHHIYDHSSNTKVVLTTKRKSEDLSMSTPMRPQLPRNARSAPLQHIYTK